MYVTPDIEKSTVDRKQEKHTGKGLPSPSRGLFLGIGLSSRGTEMFRNDSFFLTWLLVQPQQRQPGGGCVTVGSGGRELPSIEESGRWSQGMGTESLHEFLPEHRG